MAELKHYFTVVENRSGVWIGEDEIAYLSDQSGVTQVWKLSLSDKKPQQLTFYTERIWRLCAAGNHEDLIFTTDLGGNEQEQIYLLRKGAQEAVDLTRDGSSRFYMGGTDRTVSTLYYACNQRSKASFDICRMDIESGETKIVLENHDNYNLPASVSPDGRYMLYNKLKGMSDNRMYIVNMETGETRDLNPQGGYAQYESTAWKSDSSGFYVTNDEEDEFLHISYYDVAKGSLRDVYRTGWDVSALALSRDDRYLALVVNNDGYGELKILDTKSGGFLETPRPPKGFIYTYAGMEWSPVGHKLLFSFSSGRRPTGLWVLDLEADSLYAVTDSAVSGIAPEEMAEPELGEFHSFDGLRVPYWLYRAPGKEPGPGPVVLEIHGGPEGQEFPMYSPLIQYLVGQGFSVVAPNIRGSVGYGKKYHHLDDVEKRLDSVHDVACLVEHLIDAGIAAPGRIAVMGASYGGYMTLASITNYPDLWAAAIDTVGMSDLETFLENTAEYRRAHRESEYGSLAEHREVLRRVSPIHKVDRIVAPLMVIHGANDPRVPVSEADQIVESLEKRGVPVKYLRYEDEGHGLSKLKNKLDCYPQAAQFLKEHLM
ncbi:MAG: S9 family peptidase [Lachnospiraceae bacterium]|nr:S9 family peptidase [Lachnospiraceae bacterium]